ncbi:3-keto-5-aminohexanoate cleavage protein [Variovorax terrae]|uniref:3-keto-5-aminohexanoate cleavage protein n=1 Tax=Variovorax terrae TaxID=2923278 RepID=A0A9X1VUR5_9BURK|nr:3-keto-5-aminohexanoate cleavage protein [Variovorax terrae]MCJ0762374.1 3-keto-5-aminohexanoate cleavage protein [Variovorax terrae]
MHFLDGALLPENQEKLVITVAPYGPQWEPGDFPSDIAVSIDEQVQKAVDCYNAGATVLHFHVREDDGSGCKNLDRFNEVLARLKQAVPDMIIQVGGSISFSPAEDGEEAKWLSDEERHMLARLKPTPEQVTVAVNTGQMNIVEMMTPEDRAGTSFARQAVYDAYEEMIVPAGPAWLREHLAQLRANSIQPHFQITLKSGLVTLERMIRQGLYKGPLNATWVAISGGFDNPDPYSMMEFIRLMPDGSTLTLEAQMRAVLPINTMAIAMGLHVRCGIEDTLWGPSGEPISSVQQVEQLVRISRELGRGVASSQEARAIYKIGTHYETAEQTLSELRYPVARRPIRPALAERKAAS